MNTPGKQDVFMYYRKQFTAKVLISPVVVHIC